MNRPLESAADHHKNSVAIVARNAVIVSVGWCAVLRGAKPPVSTHATATVANQMTCTASLGFPLTQEMHAAQAITGLSPTMLQAVAVRVPV